MNPSACPREAGGQYAGWVGSTSRTHARTPPSWVTTSVYPAAHRRRIVVMCKVGGRSAEATRLARAAGYTHVVNHDGGVQAWVREVVPTQPAYCPPGSRGHADGVHRLPGPSE